MPNPIPEAELLRIIDNLMRSSSSSARIMHTDFLDAAAAEAVLAYAQRRYDGLALLSGGHSGAERKMLFLFPPGEASQDISRFISLVEIIPADKKQKLAHRDYLGSIMAAGLSRTKLGDIIVTEKGAQVFSTPQAAKILMHQLDRVAGTGAAVKEIPLEAAAEAKEEVFELTLSVSSLRLDCVVAAVYKMARSKASEAVAKGLISVNWKEILKPDYVLSQGDMIGFRGKGRARLKSIGGLSRKGHTFITVEIM